MNRRPVSSLEDHLGYWMRFVSNHVSHAFALKLEARGVTVAEWVVLRRLFDEADGVNPSRLAEQAGLSRGAVSKLVDRLAAKGLVDVSEGPDDRRFQTLRLTAAGRRRVPALAALADQNDAEFFGHLDAARRDALAAALKDVVARRGLRAVPVD